ncbi:hypothetical protein MHBO_000839 [Bonamia ostreae]|uniref:Uncharacterized protein n=1 Tax=Bonamia ostreae TaxID=126728 RepID=A0ABV2AH15_9EUKA
MVLNCLLLLIQVCSVFADLESNSQKCLSIDRKEIEIKVKIFVPFGIEKSFENVDSRIDSMIKTANYVFKKQVGIYFNPEIFKVPKNVKNLFNREEVCQKNTPFSEYKDSFEKFLNIPTDDAIIILLSLCSFAKNGKMYYENVLMDSPVYKMAIVQFGEDEEKKFTVTLGNILGGKQDDYPDSLFNSKIPEVVKDAKIYQKNIDLICTSAKEMIEHKNSAPTIKDEEVLDDSRFNNFKHKINVVSSICIIIYIVAICCLAYCFYKWCKKSRNNKNRKKYLY